MSMGVTIEAYNIICNYDPILARQNKIKVLVQVRYMRSLKFIDVFNDALIRNVHFIRIAGKDIILISKFNYYNDYVYNHKSW